MQRTILSVFILTSLAAGFVLADPGRLDLASSKPPVAKQKPRTTSIHGETFTDPYFWLREKGTPDVTAYLEAENAYTAAVTKPLEAAQEKIYSEILSHIKQTDLSVPVRRGDYWYYSREEKGKQYRIYCRKKGSLEAPEEIILDANQLAKGHKFFSVGQQQVSDDANLLAYATDTTGFREYHLAIKDLRTGKNLPDQVGKIAGLAWAADNKTFFYVTEDHAKRAHKLWRHVLGTPKDSDVLVYEEKDELYRLGVGRSRDKKYIMASVASSNTGETRFIPADQPNAEWKVVLLRENDHMYDVDHRDGLFYIHTNKDAKNYRLVTAPVSDPSPKNWKDLIPHNPAIYLNRPSVFADYLVVSESEAGLPHLRVRDFATGAEHRVSFPEATYSASMGSNPEFATPTFHLNYQSMVTPGSVYEYNPKTRERKLLKQTEVPGYDPTQYQTERIWATAQDGVKVPISIVSRKGVSRDGKAPLMLYGYGSYGATMPVSFSPARLPMLDRGVVYALAHIRGGKDLGQQWHDQGKMLNKKNTFTDFIACADHLVAQGYGARDRMAIQGGSAGGLLVGATINFRPDLCKIAVLQVPFVDVINTMLDSSLPLTVQEYLEWGNPNNRTEYEYMKSYCPYTNIAAKAYPSILVTTSLNDSQVMYWEPAKYVAKMRATKTDRNPLLFKCNMAGGHGGSSGRYDSLREQAFIMAVVLDQIGALN
jgi:oligopeptidase B